MGHEKSSDTITSILKDGKLDQKMLEKAYQEAITITIDVANYLEKDKKIIANLKDKKLTIIHASESLRMSSCLMQSIAWFMVQMAVNKGEISKEEASKKDSRLGGKEICLGVSHHKISFFSEEFQSLVKRTQVFYERVERLDRFYYQNQGNKENPVHAMIAKIHENQFDD